MRGNPLQVRVLPSEPRALKLIEHGVRFLPLEQRPLLDVGAFHLAPDDRSQEQRPNADTAEVMHRKRVAWLNDGAAFNAICCCTPV